MTGCWNAYVNEVYVRRVDNVAPVCRCYRYASHISKRLRAAQIEVADGPVFGFDQTLFDE